MDDLPETSRLLNDGGRESERESDGGMDDAVANNDSSQQSEWEASDFMSSQDSCDDWLPQPFRLSRFISQ